MSNDRDGAEYLAKIKSGIFNWRSSFVYDTRTKSIRLAHKPQFTLANIKGSKMRKGANVVFRSYARQLFRETFTVFQDKKILNIGLQCLTPSDYRAEENNNLIWWKCSGHQSQKWKKVSKVPFQKLYGDYQDKKFQIQLNMHGKRLVYISAAKNGSEHILKIRRKAHGWRTYFIYDKRTKSIRLFRNRVFALSN